MPENQAAVKIAGAITETVLVWTIQVPEPIVVPDQLWTIVPIAAPEVE